MVQVGIVKGPVSDAMCVQPPQQSPQGAFRRDSAEDEMRRLVAGRNQRIASRFHARVASLHGLLLKRKVRPNKDVDVWGSRTLRCNLREAGVDHAIAP
jgi:hypothetical protein